MDNENHSNTSSDDKTKLLAASEGGTETVNEGESHDNVMDIIGNGQLIKKILVEGHSEQQPLRGDLCKINLIGKLENGTVVEELIDEIIQIGDVEVVQGVDMAVALMKIGEKAEIACEPRFAYSALGLKNEDEPSKTIPGNAKVIYEVEVLESNEEDDLETKSYSIRQRIGNKKRERGNFWYERNEYNLAIQLYRRALEYLDDTDPYIGDPSSNEKVELTNDQLQELLEIRVKVYNNLAAAQMKISAYDTALVSVDNVLRCQPENVKALFRKGKILEAKGDIKTAIPILQKAAILDPESKAIQQLLSKCVMKSRREARNEKDLYQKMLGHTLKLEEKGKQTKQTCTDTSKFKLWGYLSSILIVVAGVAIYRYKYF